MKRTLLLFCFSSRVLNMGCFLIEILIFILKEKVELFLLLGWFCRSWKCYLEAALTLFISLTVIKRSAFVARVRGFRYTIPKC